MIVWIAAFAVSVLKYRYWAWLPDYVPEVMWVFAAIKIVVDSMITRAEMETKMEVDKYIVDKGIEAGLINAEIVKECQEEKEQ